MNEPKEATKKSFKDTLNLPTTAFPIRANPKEDDIKLLNRWQLEDLYTKTFFKNAQEGPVFILHDGPPYSNGHIHMGTAYNKIIKDVVTKARRMLGYHVPVTPGWDCHGLPIEQKVLEEQKELAKAPKADIKRACRKYAQRWVGVQKDEFKQLGVLMDWDKPYLTMSPEYESSILNAFAELVDAGYIERKNKTVPWCIHCQTVLAAAEIEYAERKDNSVYVLFPIVMNDTLKKYFNNYDHVYVAIWTTMPWTIPLNRAVLMKPDTTYVLTLIDSIPVIIGKECIEQVGNDIKKEITVVKEFDSQELDQYNILLGHPLNPSYTVPLIAHASVMTNEGTAFVHCSPGSGPDDYEVALMHDLEIFAPITPDGRYMAPVEPFALRGMSVEDGQIWVIKELAHCGALLGKTTIRHSYPHCWRCRKGLIFRATKQWFCNLAANDLKKRTLTAISGIQSVPAASANRLLATIEGRLEWCLSRQRAWGVPLVGVLCKTCDALHTNKNLILFVANGVAKEGVEYWDNLPIADLQHLLPTTCQYCGSVEWLKETDILDVWFDSGVSHCAVLQTSPYLSFPADLYLEGKDQHRGWFQSSLLTSIAIDRQPCTKAFLTLGFIVDGNGKKMSKSLGNVVAPNDLIAKLGTDGVRLWATSNDFNSDVVLSDVLVNNVQEVFRKIRNTARFLLSNLYDFNHTTDAVPLHELTLIDRYALQQLFMLNHRIVHSYVSYDIIGVYHELNEYCTNDLSALYLDIVKDRLYTEKADGHKRRSAQTACYYILDTLTKLAAPILSFTTELISDEYQKDKSCSIHLQDMNTLSSIWISLVAAEVEQKNAAVITAALSAPHSFAEADLIQFKESYQQQWGLIKKIRSVLLKAIEEKRADGLVKHPLEVSLTIAIDVHEKGISSLNELFNLATQEGKEVLCSFIKELTIVSQCTITTHSAELPRTAIPGLNVLVEHALGDKCQRCWQWEEGMTSEGLCQRCHTLLAMSR